MLHALRHAIALLAASIALSFALCLSGCFGIPAEAPVAATVNGEAILEEDVTSYIEGFRLKNDAYGTDDGWSSYLASTGYTPESFRQHVLDTVFVPNLVISQECAKRNIQVTDDQLDLVLEQEKAYYENRYGNESWESVLASFGYDEETWRENEELRLLEEQLTEVVVDDKEAKRSEVLTQARETGRNYNGKHSYYIAFDSLERAQDARKRLGNAADGKTTKKKFSKLGNTVNAGWNSITADRDNMSNEYTSALNELSRGSVSEPVETNGAFYLLFCDQVFTCPATITYNALSKFPDEIYAQLKADADKAHVETRFQEWLEKAEKDSEIHVTAMPEGLPYDTDVSLAGRR